MEKIRKIVILTKTGQSPTKQSAEKLLQENLGDFEGQIEMRSGLAYLQPAVLSAGIRKGEVDAVYFIDCLLFPPTEYNLAVIEGENLEAYGAKLAWAKKGETSWQVADLFVRSANSRS